MRIRAKLERVNCIGRQANQCIRAKTFEFAIDFQTTLTTGNPVTNVALLCAQAIDTPRI